MIAGIVKKIKKKASLLQRFFMVEQKKQNPNPFPGSDLRVVVDPKRIELSTSALRTQRSPS